MDRFGWVRETNLKREGAARSTRQWTGLSVYLLGCLPGVVTRYRGTLVVMYLFPDTSLRQPHDQSRPIPLTIMNFIWFCVWYTRYQVANEYPAEKSYPHSYPLEYIDHASEASRQVEHLLDGFPPRRLAGLAARGTGDQTLRGEKVQLLA